MSAPQKAAPRTGAAPRPRRPFLWTAAALALVLVAGAGLFLILHSAGGSSPAPRAAAARTLPAPKVTSDPLTSDPSLATAAPAVVPKTVLADVPGLPKALPPVGLGQASTFANDTSVRLVSIKAVTAQAHMAGQISGPALAVTVQVTNSGSAPIALDTVSVNVYSGAAGTPAVRMQDHATQPLRGSLAAGKSLSATYVFSVPTADRSAVTVAVAYGAGGGTAIFSGAVS